VGDNGVFRRKKATAANKLARFLREVPSALVFSAAWGAFTDIFVSSLCAYDATTVADAHAALRFHELWILERSLEFEWHSVAAYHLSVLPGRFASGFNVTDWYKVVDADAWTRLQARRAALPPAGGKGKSTQGQTQQPAAAGPSRAAAAATKPAATTVCNNYNMGMCSGECGRLHACKRCKGNHRAVECTTKPKVSA
jgi:hypothetical protein